MLVVVLGFHHHSDGTTSVREAAVLLRVDVVASTGTLFDYGVGMDAVVGGCAVAVDVVASTGIL